MTDKTSAFLDLPSTVTGSYQPTEADRQLIIERIKSKGFELKPVKESKCTPFEDQPEEQAEILDVQQKPNGEVVYAVEIQQSEFYILDAMDDGIREVIADQIKAPVDE